jgi:hypothetical protein
MASMKKNTSASDAAVDTRTTSDKGERPVVVTTAHRGVFFGFARADHQLDAPTIRIERARNCLWWEKSIGGFLGLAADGPTPICRIGARVPALTLRDVTSVAECSPEAVAKWEAAASVR